MFSPFSLPEFYLAYACAVICFLQACLEFYIENYEKFQITMMMTLRPLGPLHCQAADPALKVNLRKLQVGGICIDICFSTTKCFHSYRTFWILKRILEYIFELDTVKTILFKRSICLKTKVHQKVHKRSNNFQRDVWQWNLHWSVFVF